MNLLHLVGNTPPNLKTGPGYSDLMKPYKGAWINEKFLYHWEDHMKDGTKVRESKKNVFKWRERQTLK